MRSTTAVASASCQVVGVDWGGWHGSHSEESAALLDRLGELLAAGELRPPSPQTYAFADARVALRDLMERRVLGKAVLLMQ